jgi:hypothetical protein
MTDKYPHLIRSDQPLPLPATESRPVMVNGAASVANGHAIEAPADEAAVQADEFIAFWHGEIDPALSRPWTVHGTIPEIGVGLLSGQWGTYKTFVAIDLGCAVMSGTPIFGSDIDRRGGVLLYAAEGEHEVPIRLQASIDSRCPELAKAAPFAWLTSEKCPLNLLDPRSVSNFITRVQRVDAEMKRRFNLPVVLILVDTVVATAGFTKSGDENDAVLGAALMKKGLGAIARKIGAFVLGVDHFGKTAETGTRGSSGKEDNADVVFATLGEKSIAGIVTNPRLAVRKARGGVAGREYAFTTRIVDTGALDAKLRPITTLAITWGTEGSAAAPKKDRWSKSLTVLRRVLMNMIDKLGKEMRPYTDGLVVRAVDIGVVRAEFYKEYPVDHETTLEQQKDARKKAFGRAMEGAQGNSLVGVREIDGTQYVWLT